MNKRQKEVLQAQLNSEEEVIAQLKSTYEQALGDCEAKIQELSMRADLEPENIQSIIYQKQYQEAIKAQLEGALANLQSNSYATVSDYLTRSYQEGYLGAMYDMQGQGIPLVMPIDQEAVTRAVMLDTKLSTSLYNKMGEDVKILKKAVQQEVSRGIAQGMSWSNIASNLARNMKHTPFQKAYNNSIRIARTEGHRIQNNATLDAQKRAKDRGAEVVKQWDSTLDGKTRSEHRELDGQIREVGEMFEVAGYKVEAPGLFGDPSQDCNCRCCLNQMAKWLLDCGIDKMDNFTKETVSFESPEEYEEWKKAYWSDENIAYMNYVTEMENKYGKNFETVLNSMTDKEYERYKRLLDDNPMYKTEDFKGKYLKGADEESAEYFGLDKTENFNHYKSKYLEVDEQTRVSGAYNNNNDPEGKKRDAHADLYYDELRNSSRDDIVETIANNAGVSSDLVSRMYDHLLINEYELDGGKRRFDSDYYIAQSIQRLREGKNIQEHDIILIQHEALEYNLMNNSNMNYNEAHKIANESYNYGQALDKWLDGNEN